VTIEQLDEESQLLTVSDIYTGELGIRAVGDLDDAGNSDDMLKQIVNKLGFE
jgi:hypothetical protein